MCVFAWENLNELFCLLFSHHPDSVVFTSVCETGESWDSVVFTTYFTLVSHFLLLHLQPPVHRWTRNLPTYTLQEQASAGGALLPCLEGAGLHLPEAEERS